MDQKHSAFQLSKLIWFYMSNYMDKEIVSQQCYGEPCVVKTKDGNVLMRRPYPEVTNNNEKDLKFTLQGLQVGQILEIEQNVTLKWACPIINVMERPDLVGIEIDE